MYISILISFHQLVAETFYWQALQVKIFLLLIKKHSNGFFTVGFFNLQNTVSKTKIP